MGKSKGRAGVHKCLLRAHHPPAGLRNQVFYRTRPRSHRREAVVLIVTYNVRFRLVTSAATSLAT